jgi:hypothetical protein
MAKVYWKMTKETFDKYIELSNEMVEAQQEGDLMRFGAAVDAFKSLPGRPGNIHEELDLVVPLVVDDRIIISSGSVN